MGHKLEEFKKIYYWLDNDKYDYTLKELTLYGWCDLIGERVEALDQARKGKKSVYMQSIVESIKDNSILDIEEKFSDSSLYYPAPVEVLDYTQLHIEAYDNPIPLSNIKKDAKQYLSSEDCRKKYEEWLISDPHEKNFWEFIGEEQRYHSEDFGVAYLNIDLSATDTTIIEAIKRELPNIRKRSKFKPFKKNINENDIARYIKLRIIQYTDIEIFSRFHDIPIPTYKQLALLLYPDEIYSDIMSAVMLELEENNRNK